MQTNSYYAFFDIDGTITKETTMLSYLNYALRKYYGSMAFLGEFKLIKYYLYRNIFSRNKDRAQLNKEYYQVFRGMSQQKLLQIGQEWFTNHFNRSEHVFNTAVLQEIEQHKKQGATIVLVSGGFSACIDPLAEYLKINEILCVDPQVKQGRYTGAIHTPQTIGEGKVDAMKLFLGKQAPELLPKAFAYGDHLSDLPMLKIVGNPVVVHGDAELEKLAQQNYWKII